MSDKPWLNDPLWKAPKDPHVVARLEAERATLATNQNRTPTGGEERPKRTAKGRYAAEKRRSAIASRFKAINDFVDFAIADLSPVEVAVWITLWRDTRNGLAQIAQSHIAKRLKVCDRTIRRAICGLVDKGLVEVAQHGGFRRGVNFYRVVGRPPEAT